MKADFTENCHSHGKSRDTGQQMTKIGSWSGMRDFVMLLLLATSTVALVFVFRLSKRMHDIESKFEQELIQSHLSVDHLETEYSKLTSLLVGIDEAVRKDDAGRHILDPQQVKDTMRIRRSTGSCMCPPGPKGERGSPGFDGPKGEKGQRGEMGQPGLTGLKGSKGVPGEERPAGVVVERGVYMRGPPGLNGEKGEPGRTGNEGEKGARGERGYKGDKGEKGYFNTITRPVEMRYFGDNLRPQPMARIGIPGPRGPPGRPGIGYVGQKGERGEIGDKGDKGDAGSPGRDGVDGAKGAAGLKGSVGEPGLRGREAEEGPQGRKGEKGECVKEIADDSTGYNPNSIEAWNLTCSCIISEKGSTTEMLIPGPPGPKGSTGVEGPPGQRGMRGVQGSKGDRGHSGSPGRRGARGKRGVRGKTGKRGLKGMQGEPGRPGLDASSCRLDDYGLPIDRSCYQYKEANHRRRKRGGYKGSPNAKPAFSFGRQELVPFP